MSLFDKVERDHLQSAMPLAARMRPRKLAEFIGQEHLLGEGQLLRRLIDADRLGSLVFYGPPGTGKTTLAFLLASATKRRFVQLSAISSGVKEIREELARARDAVAAGDLASLLFVDEIHRFNRAQQDVMLADVENGVVSLIGATTSNPNFAINGALLSRSRIFEFHPLTVKQIEQVVRRALENRERGLGELQLEISPAAVQLLSELTDGDARQTLSILEIAAVTCGNTRRIEPEQIRSAAAQRTWQYDASGTEHYDCASALIKSIRGSDVDAAIYWLARMLEGGEDIRFLCRRLVILASEDIGNADPHALPLAVACFTACEQVGLPEAKYLLAQTTTYLACAPKSNASTLAIGSAIDDVRNQRVQPVPKHLRSGGFAGQRLVTGVGYHYSHNAPDAISPGQEYLSIDREYYQPVDRGFERELQTQLAKIRERQKQPGTDDVDAAPRD